MSEAREIMPLKGALRMRVSAIFAFAVVASIPLITGCEAPPHETPHMGTRPAMDRHDAAVDPLADHATYQPGDIVWRDGPAALPRGARMAVLQGDPAHSGPFTVRFRLPDGYRIPPHWHPGIEHITVLQGRFHLGMGDRFDDGNAMSMPAGSFAFMNPGMRHFAFTRGETIIQRHGIGPWEIHYLNPADDPRRTPG
jgi:hypothetical protein